MIKFYYKNFTRRDYDNLQEGDVIIYPSKNSEQNNYLIVSHTGVGCTGKKAVFGQIATTTSIDSIFMKDIVSE